MVKRFINSVEHIYVHWTKTERSIGVQGVQTRLKRNVRFESK